MENFHEKSIKEVYKKLESSEKGLSKKEVKSRLRKYGRNEIKQTNKLAPLKILFEQIKSFLIYVLFFAAAFSFFVGNFMDGIVILAVVVINSGIGFFQQYRAEKAIIGLRKFLVQTSKVLRDDQYLEIPSTGIVPGDILILEAGDKVNADARIIQSEELETNEAILTGESLPVAKGETMLKVSTILAERRNMVYAGTQIITGTAKAIVVKTGMNSEFGKIASDLQEIVPQKTPMQKKLDVFSKQLSFIIFGLVIIIFFIGLLRATDTLEMLMVAITLAVGAIPEGLPAILAIGFAIASKAMSKKNVIIKKLPAVESLGSVTVICSDKTGTMTAEQMEVQRIFSENNFYIKKDKNIFLQGKKINIKENKDLFLLLKTSILCNNARFEINQGKYRILGDPTEQALVLASLDFGLNKKTMIEAEPSMKKFEFSSHRKMMSVIRKNKDINTMYSKGAPEKIIELCDYELFLGRVIKLTSKRKKQLLDYSKEMEQEALRVLGFAYKDFSSNQKMEEDSLVFLGFAGMLDPPRKEVAGAIKQTRAAGIEVKMITGDSLITAKSIAMKIGIGGNAITGTELDKMSDSKLKASMGEISIFARTTPNQKLRIVRILQESKEVVAITGDGINDVLALKAGDVGIAMGIRGTDVARDVSDVVLIDDNFASIVEGVKQGRKIYDNIKKFTKYMLSVNFSIVLLVSILTGLGFLLPILPLQILWMNLITDSFPALTLISEKGENVMASKPRKEKNLMSGIWRFVLLGGILNFLACLVAYIVASSSGLDYLGITTMVLTTGVIFELLFVYTCRSDLPLNFFKSKDKKTKRKFFFSNKWMNYAILLGLLLHLILLYSPLGTMFNVVPLALKEWFVIIPLSFSGLVFFEVFKRIKLLKKK